MNHAPTSLDTVASILVLIIMLASALTLFGMGTLMAIGAIFSNRPLVTSMSSDQEHAFASYERHGSSSNSQAWTFSIIGAVVLTVFATAVAIGVEPDKRDISKDMDMSNLTKKRSAAPKPDPVKSDSAAPAEAPKPDTPAPAEAPKPDTPAPAAPQQ